MSRLETAEIVIDAVDKVPLIDGIDQTEIVLCVNSASRPVLHLPRDIVYASTTCLMDQTGAGFIPSVVNDRTFIPVVVAVGAPPLQDLEAESDEITFVAGTRGIAAELPIPPESSGSESAFFWG